MLRFRNALVKFANKLVARSISTNWNHNGEMRLVRSVLEKRKGQPVIVDIGANIGQWAQDVLKLNSMVHVYCFEPIPELFNRIPPGDRLKKFNLGLGLCDDTVVAYQVGFGGSLIPEKQSSSKENKQVNVALRNADAFIRETGFERIDYIKVDVDGTELDVIRGLDNTIRQYRPIVQFEFGFYNYKKGDSFYSFFKFFSSRGYELYAVTPSGPIKIDHYSDLSTENPVNLNYVAFPVST